MVAASVSEVSCAVRRGAGPSGASAPYAGLPATTVFHSAFADPTASHSERERESIDTRVLVVWDDAE